LRAVLLKVVKKYVLPVNPQEAGELLGEFYPTWTPEPNDSLDDLHLGGEGEEGDEAEADEPLSGSSIAPHGERGLNRNSAGHVGEAENVVAAKDATWGLEAWLDISGGDTTRGVESSGGGQRIAFRRP
jgi:hypothetical protein